MEKQIQYIDINNLHPHPQNPRIELGDIGELAESIRVNGVMQNLTVVRRSDGQYTVIIGHRRLAGAKLAGLKKVPCVVADMDERQQVATMLLENIQRSDLTVYEQAQGFQLMFNLGETAKSISEKTGFSKETIRKRVGLLKYDGSKLKEAEERGGTLQDFYELNAIEDDKLRNKVLETVGTSNFRAQLQSAKTSEIIKKNKPAVLTQVKRFAEYTDDILNKVFVASYYLLETPELIKTPDDAGHIKYYWRDNGHFVYLYKDRLKSFDEVRQELKEEQNRVSKDMLEELSRNALKLRIDFMKNYVGRQRDIQLFIDVFAKEVCSNFDCIDLEGGVLDRLFELVEESDCEAIMSEAYKNCPFHTFGCFAYAILENPNARYFNNDLVYKMSEALDNVYDFLQQLGYELSDEELSLKNGTHALLKKG